MKGASVKRVLLLVLMIGLPAGQASGDMYVLNASTASLFRQVGVSTGDGGLLTFVVDRGGTNKYYNPFGFGVYESTMQGQIGFVGLLSDSNRSGTAWMRIGGSITPGAYDSFLAYIANDDQSAWAYRLYASDGATTVWGSTWRPLGLGTHTVLELVFASPMTVTSLGFDVEADYSLSPAPSITDAFQTSVVPVPAAVVLGFLGLGLAGVKLRRLS